MAPITTPKDKWLTPLPLLRRHLPLCLTDTPTTNARAAATAAPPTGLTSAANLVTHFLIGHQDMAIIYMSLDPYHQAFEEELDLRKFNHAHHPTAGLSFVESHVRLLLATMSMHTPGARLPQWCSNLCRAWLIKINNTNVSTTADAQLIFQCLHETNAKQCTLLFDHHKINHDISNNGLPIMHTTNFTQLTLDQLNNRTDLTMGQKSPHEEQCHTCHQQYNITSSSKVLNCTSKAMKLTCGRLLKLNEWNEWHQSE